MGLEYINYAVEEGVAFITINRPDKLNTMNPQVYGELGEAFDQALADPAATAVLFSGEGSSFSAGYDLGLNKGEESAWELWMYSLKNLDLRKKIWHSHKPVVCAVQGYALGIGFELANLADLVIAADDAVFGEPEIRYSFLTLPITVYLVGLRHIKEIMMLGEQFGAADAYRVGLVNRVVPRAQLMPEARRIAAKLAKMPDEPMRMMKHMLNKALDLQGFSTMQEWGADLFTLARMVVTPEAAEFRKITEEQGPKAAIRWAKEHFGS